MDRSAACIPSSSHAAAATPFRSGSSTARRWPSIAPASTPRARAFAEAAGFEPKAGRHLLLPGADGGLGGVLFGLETADEPQRDPFLPARLPGLLPAGTYRFANAPHDARLAALAFALGAYRFTATASATTRPCGSCCRTASMATSCRASPRRHAGARSHQHAGQRHGAGRARRRPRARSRSSTAPSSRSIVGDELLQAELSADPRRRPRRRRARAAADRSALGRSDASEGHAGRQGRVLRHRRARHQARQRHAAR